jgi:hypothetical protein
MNQMKVETNLKAGNIIDTVVSQSEYALDQVQGFVNNAQSEAKTVTSYVVDPLNSAWKTLTSFVS